MVIEKEQLIVQLENIKNHDFELNEENDATYFLSSMLYYIGDPDAYLRDELIYEVFHVWIVEMNYFEEEERVRLLERLISDEFLLNKSKNFADQLTLKRSFAALVIASLLEKNLEEPYLSQEQLLNVAEAVHRALSSENDYRGFTEEFGWVHAIAHYADAVGKLLLHEIVSEKYVSLYADAIEGLWMRANVIFNAAEDERLTSAIYESIFESGHMDKHEVENWLEKISNYKGSAEEALTAKNSYLEFVVRTNKKHFVRSLYFRGLKRGLSKEWLKKLCEAEKLLCRYV